MYEAISIKICYSGKTTAVLQVISQLFSLDKNIKLLMVSANKSYLQELKAIINNDEKDVQAFYQPN
jgi:hypothetical protein